MKSFDVAIVGAGPAGYLCAEELAKAGLKVALIDRYRVGGTCLNRGCIPSKAILGAAEIISRLRALKRFSFQQINPFDPASMLALRDNAVNLTARALESTLSSLGVEVITGEVCAASKRCAEVKTESGLIEVSFKNLVIAVGSRSANLPNIEFDGRFVTEPEGFLKQKKLPKSIVIIGAGNIGVELASAASAWGASVSLVELMPQILPGVPEDIAKIIKDELVKSGVKVYLEANVQKIERRGEAVGITFVKGKGELFIESEQLIIAIGRKPNTAQQWIKDIGLALDSTGFIEVDPQGAAEIDGVFAIGDCTSGYMLAHRAYADALRASALIAHEKRLDVPKAIPRVIFSRPEIALVGLSESEARSSGLGFYAKKYPFAGLGKANAIGERAGFIRLVVDDKSGAILGVEIVGEHASELSGIASICVEWQMTVERLTKTVFAHPTLSEIFWEAVRGL